MILKNLYSLFFTLIFSVGLSAQEEIDYSKFDKINYYIDYPNGSSKEKTDSIRRYHRFEWEEYNEEESIYFESLIQKKIDDSKSEQATFYWKFLIGSFKVTRGNIGAAAYLFQDGLKISKKLNDAQKVDFAYSYLSSLYFDNGLYDLTIKMANGRVESARNSGDSLLFSNAARSEGWKLTNIGYEQRSREIQETAVTYLREAFDFVPQGNTPAYGEASIILCMALARSDRRPEAIVIALNAIDNVFPKESSYYYRYLEQLGYYYLALDQKDSANYFFQLKINHESEFLFSSDDPNVFALDDGRLIKAGQLLSLISYYVYFDQNNLAAALIDKVFAQENIELHPNVLAQYNSIGSEAYYKIGEYKKAAECYQGYMEFTDSSNTKYIKTLQDAGTAYADAQIKMEQNRTLEVELKQKEITKKEKENKKIILYSFGIGSFGLIIFLFIIYKRFKKSQRQKEIIENQKIEVEQQKNEIVDSIVYAKRIQKAILPPASKIDKYLPNSFVLYKPKDIVAGDFYWLQNSQEGVIVAAADCTGHGVPGAMVSVVCNNGLNRATREFKLTDPGEILDKTREIVTAEFAKSEEDVKDGMDIALIKIKGTQVQFAGALNPLWIVKNGSHDLDEIKSQFSESALINVEKIANSTFIEVKGDKQPIGVYHQQKPFISHTIELDRGDRIYIFSDGFADQFGGEKGKKFKAKNFKKLLISIQEKPIDEQGVLLEESFEGWKGNLEQLDDVCVIGVRL
jgi:serine phosphatase RsbU (regulator of sigma subunit)